MATRRLGVLSHNPIVTQVQLDRGGAYPAGRRNVRSMKHSAAQDSAAKQLRHWESGGRDDAVREGAGAGLSLARIQKITGLGTTTIMRILNNQRRPRP